MKCYELPDGENPPENNDDLELSIAPESDSDTEACTTDDELSGDDKSSLGEESEENANGNLDGIVLYLSNPGTSFSDRWNSSPRTNILPSDFHRDRLAQPPVNSELDYSLRDCSNQYAANYENWDQDTLCDMTSEQPPLSSHWDKNFSASEHFNRRSSYRYLLNRDSSLRNPPSQYVPPIMYLDQDSSSSSERFSIPTPFRVALDQDSPPRDHYSRLIQSLPPRSHCGYNAPTRVHLSQDSPPRNRLSRELSSTTLPRPLFHDMIYNRDEFMARQNNPNHRRNFVAASNIYQNYLDISEEADNERLASNAASLFQEMD